MGCSSSTNRVEQDSASHPTPLLVAAKPSPADNDELATIETNTNTSGTPYATPASNGGADGQTDFHSIANAPTIATNLPPSSLFILSSPKKKRGLAIGMGKQANAHDLSSELTAVGSTDSERAMALFDRFLLAIHTVSAESNMTRACEIIIEQACRVLSCQRASLFFVDNETDELELFVGKGAKNIRMPRGKGLAGHCAVSGETVIIPDAHLDARFDPSHDAASGFRTRDVVACPVRDKDGFIVGVLMCINKLVDASDSSSSSSSLPVATPASASASSPVFGPLDRILVENFSSHTGLILRNCQLYEESRTSQRKVETLLDIVQLLHSEPNTNSLIFTLTNRTPTLMNADRCTLYLVHKPSATLVVQQGNVDIRIPLSKGLAGSVARSGTIVNIVDCYADDRFDQSVDRKTGYKTKSMLCMPIFGRTSRGVKPLTPDDVIGVLQVINPKDESVFGEADERLLTTLLDLAGPILAASSFFSQQSIPMSEAAKMRAPVGGVGSPVKQARGGPARMRRVTEAELEAMDPAEAKKLAQLHEENGEGDEEEEEEE